MAIGKVALGSNRFEVQQTLRDIINFGLGEGEGAGLNWASATSKFNQTAAIFGTSALSHDLGGASARGRINALIDAIAGGPVVAWGDSLTRGAGASGDGARYPAVAAGLFDPPRDILNRGIGGQTSTQIAARQGGVPILVTVDGDEIPAMLEYVADFSAGTDGWYARVISTTLEPSTLSVAADELVVIGGLGPQAGFQRFLGLPGSGLPVGTQWEMQVTPVHDGEGAPNVQFGLLSATEDSTAGAWIGAGFPFSLPFNGVAQTFSGTVGAENGRTLGFYTGSSTNTLRLAHFRFSARLPVAVPVKSVNPLYNSGNFSGALAGTLAGVPGTMTTDAEGNWTFTRSVAGPAVPCPPGTRFVPDEANALRTRTNWIWAGRNNASDAETVKSDIAAMIAHLGHSRYLVGGILNGGTEKVGTSAHTFITALNTELSALYGDRFVDLRAILIAAGDPVADAADIADDVVPGSLRADNIHLNDAGYAVVARAMADAAIAAGW